MSIYNVFILMGAFTLKAIICVIFYLIPVSLTYLILKHVLDLDRDHTEVVIGISAMVWLIIWIIGIGNTFIH